MEFVYYIINFLILLGIIVLFGRKAIVRIFKDRRLRINHELEHLQDEQPDELTETVSVDAEAMDELARVEDQLRHENESKLSKIQTQSEQEFHELNLEKNKRVRTAVLAMFEQKIVEKYATSALAAAEGRRNEELMNNILSRIVLTNGDMAYLKHHDILYVTLTSASKLPDELVERANVATTELLSKVEGKTSFWVKEDPTLIGGFRLRIGDTVYDGSVSEEIYRIKKAVERMPIVETTDVPAMMDMLNEKINEKINASKLDVSIYQLGRVLTVSDGICWMDGLADIMYGEVIEFDCGERGMVLDIQKDKIGCVIFGGFEHIESLSKVRRVGRIASVPVGDGLLGRVVNAIGDPIDGKGYMPFTEKRPIEFPAPAILDRSAVNRPLHTGIKAIDALVPIGKGQRELIVGDRQTGKTAIVVDAICNQKGKDVICIYVGIGQKETTIAALREKLESVGALDYTIIVSAFASDSATMQYIAPFAATAMGEHYMYAGKDVLIIYDDLSKHAVAYRELSLLLQRPSGREAYPGDIFYLHSRLLERSAQLSEEHGGGSMTALPIIETQAGDISSYIPTNVISITDGQIFLESELFHAGQRPAVNVGLSVSRVGGHAQTKLMKQVSSSLRTKLAQYRELAEFTQFGADVDDETRKTLNSGEHLTEALKQSTLSPIADEDQAFLLYVVSEGFADSIPVSEWHRIEKKLIANFKSVYPELHAQLQTGKKMDASMTEAVRQATERLIGEL